MTPEAGPVTTNVAYDDRFLEIWNLVFMELYQAPDGSRTELPEKNIDTGSGLERVACAIQGKRSVYETDIFLPILEEAAAVLGVDYFAIPVEDPRSYAVRAMSEHCRAAAMLVARWCRAQQRRPRLHPPAHPSAGDFPGAATGRSRDLHSPRGRRRNRQALGRLPAPRRVSGLHPTGR